MEMLLCLVFGPLLLFYISYYLKLIRRYCTKNFIKIKKTPKVEIKGNVKVEDEEIKKFVKKSVKIKCFNKSFFYHNVSNLKINTCDAFRKFNIFIAEYDYVNNIIYITSNHSLPHELTHTCSSYYDGDDYSGLSQNGLGVGINEGYTELLTERYYFHGDSYPVERKIANNLEKITGKDKMEEYYYTANLYDFVGELKQYDSEENVLKFLNCVDIISGLVDNYILCRLYYHILIKCMKKVNLYLLKWYSIKQKRLLENKLISDKQCYSNIIKYSKRLIELRNMESTKYKILGNISINKEIEKILVKKKQNQK